MSAEGLTAGRSVGRLLLFEESDDDWASVASCG